MAGTKITNVAYLDYSIEAVNYTSRSNELVDIVDQKIDMNMVCQESESIMVGMGEKKRALRFMLINRGNANDNYDFSHIEGKEVEFSVDNTNIYLDNGDGVFTVEDHLAEAVEVLADSNITLFLVSDIPSTANNISSNGIKAYSNIAGSLSYGESKSLENYYVLSATKEEAKSDFCAYEVSTLGMNLEKSATLSSDKLYVGSVIHYSLAVNVIGRGDISNIVVHDDIPLGTKYIENSLKLDGKAFGDFNGTSILVPLTDLHSTEINTEAIHHITFDVRVQ